MENKDGFWPLLERKKVKQKKTFKETRYFKLVHSPCSCINLFHSNLSWCRIFSVHSFIPLTCLVQAGRFGGCLAADDYGSGAEGSAAAARGTWNRMNPDGWEALYLPSGQDGCTDGTLVSLPKGRQIYSFF